MHKCHSDVVSLFLIKKILQWSLKKSKKKKFFFFFFFFTFLYLGKTDMVVGEEVAIFEIRPLEMGRKSPVSFYQQDDCKTKKDAKNYTTKSRPNNTHNGNNNKQLTNSNRITS